MKKLVFLFLVLVFPLLGVLESLQQVEKTGSRKFSGLQLSLNITIPCGVFKTPVFGLYPRPMKSGFLQGGN